MNRDALISPCGTYRYWLSRHWLPFGPIMRVCMLNPSTADSETDDATIRWLTGYARKRGQSGILVVNLFALRATDPKELLSTDDPVGPDNERFLRDICGGQSVLCAWGNWALKTPLADRMARVVRRVAAEKFCLARTKLGEPRHPLRMSHSRPLIEFDPITTPTAGGTQ